MVRHARIREGYYGGGVKLRRGRYRGDVPVRDEGHHNRDTQELAGLRGDEMVYSREVSEHGGKGDERDTIRVGQGDREHQAGGAVRGGDRRGNGDATRRAF